MVELSGKMIDESKYHIRVTLSLMTDYTIGPRGPAVWRSTHLFASFLQSVSLNEVDIETGMRTDIHPLNHSCSTPRTRFGMDLRGVD